MREEPKQQESNYVQLNAPSPYPLTNRQALNP